jgi:hypothetical protein
LNPLSLIGPGSTIATLTDFLLVSDPDEESSLDPHAVTAKAATAASPRAVKPR